MCRSSVARRVGLATLARHHKATSPADTAGAILKGSCARPASGVGVLRALVLLGSMWLVGAGELHAQTAPGVAINNSATIDFVREGSGMPVSVVTNLVTAKVMPAPSLSSAVILRRGESGAAVLRTGGPTQCLNSGTFQTLPAPASSGGGSIDPSQGVALSSTQSVHGGDAVFLQVTDADQNLDAAVVDTVEVTVTSVIGDQETVRLSETGPNTGVFLGYIQSRESATAASGDCVLQVDRDSRLTLTYRDRFHSSDSSSATALVDPYGRVFDSHSGQPVNGARVRLIAVSTGALATVLGDDGVSRYPAELTTGNAVTDSGGTTYTLPPGVFRFPLVAPGDYRIEVLPPSGYSAPSGRSVDELNLLPGAPFRLGAGSFGGAFTASAPVAVAVDVPVDPSGTQLYLSKSASVAVASPGDFVQYTVTVENLSTVAAVRDVAVSDVLPRGLRYRRGSARLDGAPLSDPTISGGGLSLQFKLGTLAPSAAVKLRYVAEITVAAHEQKLTNSARAFNATGAASNSAQATIRLRNDLFNDKGFILGRIVEGDCEADSAHSKGVPGVRVFLEDGRYAMTDEEGKYHFEGVLPGTHVVQLDTVTVPETLLPQQCEQRVRQAGRDYSQFVDLRAGALWRADFTLKHKSPPHGALQFSLKSAITGVADLLQTLTLQAAGVAVNNLQVTVSLPAELHYVPGSVLRDGAVQPEPQLINGRAQFDLGTMPAGATTLLTFATRVIDDTPGFSVQAVAAFDTVTRTGRQTQIVSNTVTRGEVEYESAAYRFSPHFAVMGAALDDNDRRQLDKLAAQWRGAKDLRILAVGHTDKNPVSVRSRIQFADNLVLSRARAQAVAEYLRSSLQLSIEQIRVDGRGSEEPLAAGGSPGDLAMNRRVEISIDGLRVKKEGKLSLIKAEEQALAIPTEGVLQTSKAPPPRHVNRDPVLADVDVESLQPGIAMLRPAPGDIPAISSVKIAIQHEPEQRVEMRLNGAPISALNFDGVSLKHDKRVALSRWRGVDVRNGDNILEAIVRDAHGGEVQRITRTLHFSGGAVRAELSKPKSVLNADGSTAPVIAVALFDASGNAARPGTMGTFSVDSPYRSRWEVERQKNQQLLKLGSDEPQFMVDDDGVARLELEPTTQSGMVVVHLRFSERQSQELRVWMSPQARDWVMVGLAEGTAAYNHISQNAEGAAADDIGEAFQDNGRVAYFAKGRIKGDFLLTMAYDSARDRNLARQSLFGIVDPHQYYTLYGDGSEQRFEAPSTQKLYLKLERRQFMAMFGDFNTGITVTELSRYSRSLTGVKSEFAGERVGYNAFGANTDQGYVQDQIQGDGTSGLYRLTQQNIVANSEQLRIEVRDRIRTEEVVKTATLTRYIDYDIDYLNGTLFFKQPVMSRDEHFNPQFIVVEYEVDSRMRGAVTAGGRGYVKVGRSEIGASFISEGSQAGDTKLGGVDARVHLGEGTDARVEFARTDSNNPARTAQADAYFAEIKRVSKRVDLNAYYRVQENGFGFGQQSLTETGTRKAALDGRLRLSDRWSLLAEGLRQELDATNAKRDLVSAEVRRETQTTDLGGGLRHVSQQDASVGDASSEQGFVNGSIKLLDNRLTLRAEHDLTLSGSNGLNDFPARSLIGADYALTRDVSVFADHEHADGSTQSADMTRIGVRASPWSHAQVSSSLNQQFTENGARTFANLGLTQGWQINDRLALDFGLDQSKTVRGNSDVFNSNAPPAFGTPAIGSGSVISSSTGNTLQLQAGDFIAVSAASLYRTDLWNLTDRVEHRHGGLEDRWSLTSGFYREAVKGHAFALVLQYLNSRASISGDSEVANVQLSWAFRPVESRWIVLDRLEFKHQDGSAGGLSDASGFYVRGSRIVNNSHLNLLLDPRTQIGIQVGARFVVNSFDGDRYSGASGLLGVDLRRDLTRRFDVGLHGTALESFSSGVRTTSLGADLGVTLVKNVWVSIGYNLQGFSDHDFDDARYLASGPYLKFRVKFDQDTFKDLNLAGLRGKGK